MNNFTNLKTHILNARRSIGVVLAVAALIFSANLVIRESQGTAAQPDLLAFSIPDQIEQLHLRKAVRALEAAAKAERKARAKQKRLSRFLPLSGSVSRATLESIASCESGGDPRIVSSSGLYHGKYQFSVATWQAVGGSGLPSSASEAEQDFRAALLYEQSGPGQWPVCGS